MRDTPERQNEVYKSSIVPINNHLLSLSSGHCGSLIFSLILVNPLTLLS